MSDDDLNPFPSLEMRRQTVPQEERRRTPREMPVHFEQRDHKRKVDPLDKAAQERLGTRAEQIRLDEPLPAEILDNQIMWCVVARIDGGAWSHLLAAESIRSATFPSKRRAEATVLWFRRQSETDGTGVEYRVIPVMRGEKQI